MYINVAYPADKNPNTEDLSVPLRINNCGYYRVHTTPIIKTEHPEGRNDYQLLYISSGKGHFFLNCTERIVTKGNMILYRPGEPQVYYYYAEDKTEVYWVHFTGHQVEQIIEHYALPKDENVFFTGTSPDYQWIYKQMIQELQLRRANHEELLSMLLRHILLMINRYIQEHYADEISLTRIADIFNYNSSYLSRIYKQVMCEGINEHIIRTRIEAACRLLKGSEISVSEIAAQCGFQTTKYFITVFKRLKGKTPKVWRETESKY